MRTAIATAALALSLVSTTHAQAQSDSYYDGIDEVMMPLAMAKDVLIAWSPIFWKDLDGDGLFASINYKGQWARLEGQHNKKVAAMVFRVEPSKEPCIFQMRKIASGEVWQINFSLLSNLYESGVGGAYPTPRLTFLGAPGAICLSKKSNVSFVGEGSAQEVAQLDANDISRCWPNLMITTIDSIATARTFTAMQYIHSKVCPALEP